jgi:8-hydroxy-5-deazaflavin:NADPH oxidoreductase
MTTAIVGVGNIGGAVARHLVAGGETVVLAAKDESGPQALANELGPLARAASVEDAIVGAEVVVPAVWLDTMKELIARHAGLLKGRSSLTRRTPSGSTRPGK